MGISRTLAGALLTVLAVSAVAGPPDQGKAAGGGQKALKDVPAGRIDFEGEPSPAQLLAEVSARQQLPPEAELVRVGGGTSVLSGLEYERYELRLDGIPLLGHGLTLHVRDGRVVGAFGRLPTRPTAETTPRLTEEEAREAAQHAVAEGLGLGAGAVSWAPPAPCRLSLRYAGTTFIGLQYRLYFLCVVEPVTPAGPPELAWVDAATGAVREVVPQVHYQWDPAVCSGTTVHHGDVSDLPCQKDAATGQHRLESSHVGAYRTETYEAPLIIGVVYDSPDSTFGGVNEPGVSVYWGTQTALSAVERHFGNDVLQLFLANLSASGGDPTIHTYAEAPFDNAYALLDPPRMVFGFNPGGHLVSLNVVGHELGHLLGGSVGPLANMAGGETRGLDESFGDIMGELTEQVGLGTSDWVLNNLPNTWMRDMRDPLNSDPPAPDVYGGVYWDIGKPHQIGLVHSRWFYLLAHGGNGANSGGKTWAVGGVGLEDAVAFLGTSMFELLPPAATFADARNASVQAVAQACGEFSEARIANHNAWDAVNLFPSALPLMHGYTSPVPSETAVAPWPATLTWQAKENLTETAWDIQIGKTTDLSGESLITSTGESGTEGGLLVGRIDLPLKPATRYYWRVRRADADPKLESCWRPIRSFVTRDQVPKPISPVNGQHHPWKLPFTFSPVEGATSYEIDVAWDPDFQHLVFPTKTFRAESATPDKPTGIELTVPVGQEVLYWRVRSRYARGHQPVMYSAWSQPAGFGTTTPKATLLSPANHYDVYPWPVEFTWGEVRGATYELAVDSRYDDVMVPDHRTFPNLQKRELPVYLRAYWKSHALSYDWSVSVLGPPWGSERQPEPESTREEGDLSEVWQVGIDGNDTVVDQVSPSATKINKACFAFKAPVTFTWQPVAGARQYLLQVFELECPASGYCHRTDQLVHSQYYDHQTYGVTLPSGNQGPISGPFSAPHNIGYAWRVTAVTEEGFPSADAIEKDYHVRPTRPRVTRPWDQEDLPPGEVVFKWEAEVAYGAWFLYELHEGKTCDRLDYSDRIQGAAPGETGVAIRSNDWTNPAHPVQQSFRVKPLFALNVCDPPPDWSLCIPFRVVPPEPEPPPDTPTITCGQIFNGGNNGLDYILDFGAPVSGRVRIVYDHYWVPDVTRLLTPNGSEVRSTGCTSTGTCGMQSDLIGGACTHEPSETDWASVSDISYMHVQVRQCGFWADTAWEIKIECDVAP